MIKKAIPLVIILILMILSYAYGLDRLVTWENFQTIHNSIFSYVQKHPLKSPFLFILIYIFYSVLALPGTFLLSIVAGCLFTPPFGLMYVLIASVCSGSLLFSLTQTLLGESLHKKMDIYLGKVKKNFSQNEIGSLLFLQLNPLFPFWFVSIVPAFFHVRFITFLWTSLLGNLPISFIFTQIGVGVRHIIQENPTPSFSTIFNFQVKISLAGLILLALLFLFFKRWTTSSQ